MSLIVLTVERTWKTVLQSNKNKGLGGHVKKNYKNPIVNSFILELV